MKLLYSIDKRIRWKEVIKAFGIMMIGAVLGVLITLAYMEQSISKYVEVNRTEYYNDKVKVIEKELK